MSSLLTWLDKSKHGGRKIPAVKGKQSIISHIGSEKGYLQEERLIFKGKKSLKDADYHTEMTSDVFLDWIEKKAFCNIPAGSIVVLDIATYYQKLTKES